MEKKKYADETIMSFRKKYQKDQLERIPVKDEIFIGVDRIALHREALFMGCSMLLPDTMTDIKYVECIARYWNQNRPQIMKESRNQNAFLTFTIISASSMEKTKDISYQLEKVRNDLKKIRKQNVFYDTGSIMAEKLKIAWMDFKAFCLDGSLYCILFLFQVEEQYIVGNFHCAFPQYDIWKPVILRLLGTVRMD